MSLGLLYRSSAPPHAVELRSSIRDTEIVQCQFVRLEHRIWLHKAVLGGEDDPAVEVALSVGL